MKVLFICSANICRSPLAEVVLRKKLDEKDVTGVEVCSAGILDLEGEPRDPNMIALAQKDGYDMKGKAIRINKELVESADLIICMSHYHMVEIQKELPYSHWNRIKRFNEVCFDEKTDLRDPSGDTLEVYKQVYDKIVYGCDIIALKLKTHTHII